MGNNYWMDPDFFSRHQVPQNVGNIICVCYFRNVGLGPTKSQCSPHFSKQSILGLPYLEPHRKVNATTLELFATNFNIFTKTGSHGAPMASMENPSMSKIMDFNETHYSVRQNGGSTGSSSMRNVFPLHPVTSKQPESPYGAKKKMAENQVFQFFAHGGW